MKKIILSGVIAGLLVLGVGATAFGAPIRDNVRDRLRDGSCVAADQLRDRDQLRDQLRDGSCVAADQFRDRQRDRLRTRFHLTADQLRTRTQQRDRLRDGSCLAADHLRIKLQLKDCSCQTA